VRLYAQTRRDIVVSLHDLSRAEALARLAAGEADFTVLSLEGEHPELNVVPMIDDDLVVIAPLGHPLLAGRAVAGQVTMDEVVRHAVVLPENDSFVRLAIDSEYTRRGVRLAPAFHAHGMSTLQRMVVEGMGIMPAMLIPREMSAAVGVARIRDFRLTRHYVIVSPAKAEMSPAAADFSRFLGSARVDSAV